MVLRFLRNLLSQQGKKNYVGTDLDGRKYFEYLDSGSGKMRRSLEYPRQKVSEFTEDVIPPEWASWLRGSRDEPPTMVEQEAIFNQKQKIYKNVLEYEEKVSEQMRLFDKEKEKEEMEKQQSSSEPTGSGESFQPGTWVPQQSKRD
mmetsp:Transcript_31192/g.81838  ORF Transcript_31192/g.81838 Transcript_31192/m.81838 type:complete len:146 (-) Transcript_31192:415-852(-)